MMISRIASVNEPVSFVVVREKCARGRAHSWGVGGGGVEAHYLIFVQKSSILCVNYLEFTLSPRLIFSARI